MNGAQAQVSMFPDTRYMGSKQRLSELILDVLSELDFDTALDAMSGSGFVGYLMKSMGKEVDANDYLAFCSAFARASIENSRQVLTAADLDRLSAPSPKAGDFIRRTFKGLYFSPVENRFLDHFSANVRELRNPVKRALAQASIASACLKARPRGVFTYTGERYDDGRRDLQLTLEQHLREAAARWNAAVFDNGRQNRALHGDVFLLDRADYDLVYLDPPYVSPHSDNEYTRRYHFVEGLMSYWSDVEIQQETKTKKFPNRPTPFSSKRTVHAAFDRLIAKFPRSTVVVSYSSTGIPSPEELKAILLKHRKRVDVHTQSLSYTFGTHNHLPGNKNNRVEEYLFVARR